MIEFTEQDKANYESLKDASTTLHKQKDNLRSELRPLIDAVHANIISSLQNVLEMEGRLAHVDAYLLMQDFLQKDPSHSIIQATQKLRDQSALIRASLQNIEDADLSKLDDFDFPCRDDQFLNLIRATPKINNKTAKELTLSLLNGLSLNLSNADITELTDRWGTAVSGIVKDAQNSEGDTNKHLDPGTPSTIARFFCIHEELEDLYDKVSNLVA
jgi:hypothetical protein